MLTIEKSATYEYKLNDRKSVCLSARWKIDTHTELKSSKRQAAAKTTKYSSTRITTLVFVHYSTYSFSISTHTQFFFIPHLQYNYISHIFPFLISLSLSSLTLYSLQIVIISQNSQISHTR